jgi:hypothetical protein
MPSISLGRAVPARARTSDLLRRMAQTAPERVTLAAIGSILGERQLGVVVLCMALPNIVPGPYLPGFSTVLALPIIWLGARLAFGGGMGGLPGFIGRVSFRRRRFAGFVRHAVPWLVRMERWLGPHPSFLTTPAGLRWIGAILVLYGIVLALPMPFGNIPIGLGIAIIALGLIEDDSRALYAGLGIGVLGCLWQLLLVTVGVGVIARI